MAKCACGINLSSRVGQKTGVCLSCRQTNGWTDCDVCGNTAMEPGTTSCLWCHPHGPKFNQPAPAQPAASKKDYGSQCPCGIHPSQCDYHAS